MFMRENKGLCAFKYVRDGLGPGPWEIKCVCAHRGRLRNNLVHGKGFGSDTDHKFCRGSEERWIEGF